MAEFGKQIAEFGPYMKKYAESLAGVDTSVIESSANAAEALAKLAQNLPSTGGKWQEWFGGKDLATFGEQLTTFGVCLTGYSKTITADGGIDAEAITGSADAAKGLADLAKNLPSTGGKWQEWFGGKSLATFGGQLTLFGQSLVDYSTTITADGGIDTKAITASADAAKGLGNIASNLPSTGGKWQEWFGGKSLSTFGAQLKSFGGALSDYSKTVSGENSIDTDAIENSVTASTSLAMLANNLPSYHIFDGKSSPTEFGAEIAAFGESLADYCSSISGYDMSALSESVTQAWRLVGMMKDMTGIDTSATSAFVTGLTTLAQNGVSGFITAFANAHTQVSTAVNSFMSAAVTGVLTAAVKFTSAGQLMMINLVTGLRVGGSSISVTVSDIISGALIRINGNAPAFAQAGRNLVTNLSMGMSSTSVMAATAITTIINTTLTRIKAKGIEFHSTGSALMTNFIAGLRSRDSGVSQAFGSVTSAGLTKVRDYYSSFKDAGKYLVDGFAKGIEDRAWYAINMAEEMAEDAYEAAKKKLDVNSPSRLFMTLGSSVVEGFALGIDENVGYATSSATDMASSAFDTVRSAIARISEVIDSGMNTEPTIRPILDLSNVEAGTGRLQAIFSRQQAMSVSASMDRARTVDTPTDVNASKAGSTFQFTQINNSPKALSRNEIYRQTSNQFSAFERMVKA